MLWFVGAIWSLLISAFAYMIGRIFSQSERVLDQKRKSYEDFLRLCPGPNEAHSSEPMDIVQMQRALGVLSLYGSSDALEFASVYFTEWPKAQSKLVNVTAPGHPDFLELATHYNRMVWAMRKDAMTWSVFAPTKRNQEYKPTLTRETPK